MAEKKDKKAKEKEPSGPPARGASRTGSSDAGKGGNRGKSPADAAAPKPAKSAPAVTARPKWMGEKDKWSAKDQSINSMFLEITGKEVDPEGLQHYRELMASKGADFVKKDLAISQYNAGKDVDPTKYGAVALTKDDLGAKNGDYYDAWASANGGKTLYGASKSDNIVRWSREAMSIDAFKQTLGGNIKQVAGSYKDGKLQSGYTMITPEAALALGSDLGSHFRGNKAGDTFVFPDMIIDPSTGEEMKVSFKGDNFGDLKAAGKGSGMSYTTATGNLSGGLLGALGWDGAAKDIQGALGEDLSGAISAYADVASLGIADISENIAFGQQGDIFDVAAADALGMSQDKYGQVVGVGQQVAKTAAQLVLAPTVVGSVAVEAAWQAAKAAEASAMRESFDWGHAAMSVGMSAIPTGASGGTGWANFGRSVAGQAVKSGAAEFGAQEINKAIYGDDARRDTGAILESAALGAVSASRLGSVGPINALTMGHSLAKADSDDRWAIAASQAAGTALSYYSTDPSQRAGVGLNQFFGGSGGDNPGWAGVRSSFASGGSRAGWNPMNAEAWVPSRATDPLEKAAGSSDRVRFGQRGFGNVTSVLAGSGREQEAMRQDGIESVLVPGSRFGWGLPSDDEIWSSIEKQHPGYFGGPR